MTSHVFMKTFEKRDEKENTWFLRWLLKIAMQIKDLIVRANISHSYWKFQLKNFFSSTHNVVAGAGKWYVLLSVHFITNVKQTESGIGNIPRDLRMFSFAKVGDAK